MIGLGMMIGIGRTKKNKPALAPSYGLTLLFQLHQSH